jgi:hypothetical protein
MALAWRVLAPLTLAAAATAALAQPAATPHVVAWAGRAADMEAHLRTAEILQLEEIGTGVTRPRRAYLQPDVPFASLTWKPLRPGRRGGHWESYKSEIAAYELDKLLDLRMVPPAVEREFEGEKGAAIMWIEGTRSVKQMGGKVPTGPAFNRPIRIMQLFDNVIGNPDRNAGNILIDGSNNVILIDHSRAFIEDRKLPFKFERVDAAFWSKVKALTRERLAGALSSWLDDPAIDAMLARRDEIESRVDDLVRRRGAAAVIIP